MAWTRRSDRVRDLGAHKFPKSHPQTMPRHRQRPGGRAEFSGEPLVFAARRLVLKKNLQAVKIRQLARARESRGKGGARLSSAAAARAHRRRTKLSQSASHPTRCGWGPPRSDAGGKSSRRENFWMALQTPLAGARTARSKMFSAPPKPSANWVCRRRRLGPGWPTRSNGFVGKATCGNNFHWLEHGAVYFSSAAKPACSK